MQQDNYFDEVYSDTYSKVLKYVVVRCRNHADVQDVVQNAYMNFYLRYRKYGRFHFRNPEKYIIRIAHDELSKYYKNTAVTAQNISIDEHESIELADEFLTEDIVCTQTQKDEVWKLVKQKDVLTFKIFTLYFLFDYKLSRIAAELGVSESCVKNKLYRTINELKSIFDKEGF